MFQLKHVASGICSTACVCLLKPSKFQPWSQSCLFSPTEVCSCWGVQADRLLLQVAPFFFQMEDEAGGLKQTPSGCAVKMGNKAAGVHISESGLVTEVVPPSDLKAPASIEDEAKVPIFSHADISYIFIDNMYTCTLPCKAWLLLWLSRELLGRVLP